MEVRDSHLPNMPIMSVTQEVLRYSSPSMMVRFLKLQNQAIVVVGQKSLNEGSMMTF